MSETGEVPTSFPDPGAATVSIVRTTCPRCDVITVRAPELTVRRTGAASEAVFMCPACLDEVIHPLHDRMVPVLIGAGCPVDDRTVAACMSRHPSRGAEISEAEIAEFVSALDRRDWFDELLD